MPPIKTRDKEACLIKKLESLERKLATDPSIKSKEEYLLMKAEQENICDQKSMWAMIRAKAKHVEFNGKNSKYFLNRRR